MLHEEASTIPYPHTARLREDTPHHGLRSRPHPSLTTLCHVLCGNLSSRLTRTRFTRLPQYDVQARLRVVFRGSRDAALQYPVRCTLRGDACQVTQMPSLPRARTTNTRTAGLQSAREAAPRHGRLYRTPPAACYGRIPTSRVFYVHNAPALTPSSLFVPIRCRRRRSGRWC